MADGLVIYAKTRAFKAKAINSRPHNPKAKATKYDLNAEAKG